MKNMNLLAIAAVMAFATAATAQEAAGPRRATRQSTLLGAKNMVVTTGKGTTYYYFVSSEENPMMRLDGGTVRIGADEFQRQDIKGIRFRSLARTVLNEDSTTFDKTQALDHSLLALRRTLNVGRWNSLVLPFDLTGRQLTDVFGEGTEVAQPRGVAEDGQAVVEFNTLDLQTDEVVMRANYHYMVRPTREPDVETGHRLANFGSGQLYGPIYLIPNVSMKANQSARLQSLQNEEGTVKVRLRGTYLKLDDSVTQGRIVRNRRVAPGTYLMNDEGLMEQTQDSAVVAAFRSWIEDVSPEPQTLRFYVDGVGEDITSDIYHLPFTVYDLPLNHSRQAEAVHDLSGRQIVNGKWSNGKWLDGKLPKGLYVRGGRKFIVK
ncbi:MAG: hypothetical protein IJT75_03830 [Bacteroidaceae bacterium]|nr:hypothetical protein [Bacteroidaceae bacterium]